MFSAESCSEVFAPAIARLANLLSVDADWKGQKAVWDHICSVLPTSTSFSLLIGRDSPRRAHCYRFWLVYTQLLTIRKSQCWSVSTCLQHSTVGHEILLTHLQTEFRVEGMPLTWLRSSVLPFASAAFAKPAFCCSAPATGNSLPRTVTGNDLLGTFKSRLKTFLFSLAFNWHWHYPPTAPLKLRPNSAIQIYYYYYY